MSITLESSMPFVAEIEGLSPGAQAYLYSNDRELKRRQAVDDAKAATMREARTTKCVALVNEAIHTKRARLEKEPRHKWTSILMVYYFDKRGITIDEETVRRVVKGFPGF